jgi:intracellular sulfur oxidation DsrE/DsrF family protein
MSDILKDCNKMICHIACKNTKSTMKEAGIEVIVCKDALDAKSLALKAC